LVLVGEIDLITVLGGVVVGEVDVLARMGSFPV
jgi:hypothetical protein